MKQGKIIAVFALLAFSSAIGQNFEKVVFNAKEAEDYYIQLKPAAEKIQGVCLWSVLSPTKVYQV